jgi:hypothetical protein
MVRIHPDPPPAGRAGAVAQLGEHLLCKQGVVGSIPSSSTIVGVLAVAMGAESEKQATVGSLASGFWPGSVVL